MGQWGKIVTINGARFVPHIESRGVYDEAVVTDTVGMVEVVDYGPDKDSAMGVLHRLREEFIGRPYGAWLTMVVREKRKENEALRNEVLGGRVESYSPIKAMVLARSEFYVNGYRLPRWCYRYSGLPKLTMVGKVVVWVLSKLPKKG